MEKEVARLMELIRSLPPEERRAAEYFVKHISVGDIRAVMDLKKAGIKDPETVLERLVELGVLEKGLDCYNLAKPLRVYLVRKRGVL